MSHALCSVPDSDLLRYLPELLDGLFGMIADPNRELRQAVHKALQVPHVCTLRRRRTMLSYAVPHWAHVTRPRYLQ